MITIQSGMLVALGFLAAALLALMIAPLFWRRAVRLTSRRIRESMPVSDIEIRADKDRIRAEYAIKVHKMESEIEQVRHSTARQQIEINRRDASVNVLEDELERLRASHEETLNARRVLELTVADRLPRVEQGLSDAKKLLFARDREIGELTRTAEQRTRAIDEAKSIAVQQQAEMDRLKTALAARAEGSPADIARSNGELALRSEIEALRAKSREQSQLLARLQSMAGRQGTPAVHIGLNGHAGESAMPNVLNDETEKQLRLQKSRNDDQAGEITRLKAALAVFENGTDTDGTTLLRDSRIGTKARMQSLEAQSVQQAETILRLRSDLAAANERLARQATYFTNELKRLGSGGHGTASQAQRRVAETSNRLSLTERVAQSRIMADGGAPRLEAALIPNGGHGPRADHDAAEPITDDGAAGAVVVPQPLQPVELVAEDARPRLLDRIAGIGRP